jgi:hypothetical protein
VIPASNDCFALGPVPAGHTVDLACPSRRGAPLEGDCNHTTAFCRAPATPRADPGTGRCSTASVAGRALAALRRQHFGTAT